MAPKFSRIAGIAILLSLIVHVYAGDFVSRAVLKTICGPLYLELPDIDACDPGHLTRAEEQAALTALNRIRKLHGLPPVILDENLRDEARYAALIVAANRKTSHTPPPWSRCYTVVGRRGSWDSNLAYHVATVWDPTPGGVQRSHRTPEVIQVLKKNQISTAQLLADMLIDRYVPILGHRRWILDPYVHRIAFARVDWLSRHDQRWEWVTGTALHLIAGQRPAVPLPPRTMIPWPIGDYPADLFDPHAWFSFQVLVNGAGPAYSSTVDFQHATVRITDPQGHPVPIRQVHFDNDAYGLPNLLRWHVDGIRPGIRYTVAIGPVHMMRQTHRFQYTFRIVPSQATAAEN